MSFDLLLISLVWTLPLAGALFARLCPSARSVRWTALATAVLTFLVTVVVFLRDSSEHAFERTNTILAPSVLGVHYHVAVDGLSAVLLPLTAGVALASLLSAPKAALTAQSASRALFAQGTILGVLVSMDMLLLALFWTLSLVPLRLELARQRSKLALTAFNIVLLGSAVPMLLFVIGLGVLDVLQPHVASPRLPFDLLALDASGILSRGLFGQVLAGLLLVAALARMGCFPLHLWIAPLAESGPAHLALVSFATPMGLYVMSRALVPLFPSWCVVVMPYLLPLGLVTAAYGAILALAQHDLRRMLGYFWVSQQGFLLVGMAGLNAQSVGGALLHAITSVLVRTGLLLISGAVVARTGTSDMRLLGGLVGQAPRMTTGFILFSAAAVGFPGTLGFVSEDLLVQGLLRSHGLVVLTLLVIVALNGILLYRAFTQTFLGPPSPHQHSPHTVPDLLTRERWVGVVLVGALLLGGFVPAPLLAIRQGVVRSLHQLESITAHDAAPTTVLPSHHAN